jgi:CRISPR-associated protein (TIGR03986 family)
MARRAQRRNVEPCPPGVTKDVMKGISAPYNFVPLADWVYIPSWWKQISHDYPFQDGLSGEIRYRLTATCPLLVGDVQRKASQQLPGEVKPFKLPNGRYAISGASLKGMIRSVIEIAGFGRMRLVDDARPGLRDITGSFVKESYTNKVRDQMKTGFLRQRTDGDQEIVPCEMARLDHRRLATWLGVSEKRWDDRRRQEVPDPIFNTNNHRAVRAKYEHWEQLCRDHGIADPFDVDMQIAGGEVTGLGGPEKAFPVLTGQISDFRTNKPGKDAKSKYKDFVFYNSDESRAFPVPAESWRDFLLIHGDQDSKPEMSWPGYWRRRFRNGEGVPVFYLQDGDSLRIGLAYMPKLAGDYSIHNLIEHSSPAHLQAPGERYGYDLADLLFGAVNADSQADALRGRVSFETAISTERLGEHQEPDTILNGPKPTYFPNYITQKATAGKWTLSSGQYGTYIDTGASKPPTVRGFKRYPARPEAMTHVQALTGKQQANNKVKVRLHTLPKDATFDGRIVFHNLLREELGALFWALTWDGNLALHHGLGMGKSFGFGQVRFDLDLTSQLIPNDPQRKAGTLDDETVRSLIDAFKAEMEDAAKEHGGWEASAQITNLLAMADLSAANELPEGIKLRHMHLIAKCESDGRKANINEFQWAKQQPPGPFVLADYAVATGWGQRWREQLREQQEQARKIAEQEATNAAEAELRRALQGLPEDAADLERLARTTSWRDNGEFVQAMEEYLTGRDALSEAALSHLTRLIDERLPRLLTDPHAKTGKRQKPAFRPRQIALAERVIELSRH